MHFKRKVTRITSIVTKSTEANVRRFSLLDTKYYPQTKKKNNLKQEKQCIYFRDNGENKDKLTAAGEYHSGSGCKEPGAKYMELLKENWKQMAMQLGELDVQPVCGDVWASDMYYHKVTCYMQFRDRYRPLLQQENNASTQHETILLECYARKEISNMIYDSSEHFIDVSNFKITYHNIRTIVVQHTTFSCMLSRKFETKASWS